MLVGRPLSGLVRAAARGGALRRRPGHWRPLSLSSAASGGGSRDPPPGEGQGAGGAEAVVVGRGEAVWTVEINRPHRKNAVNTATAAALYAAFRSFEATPAAKALVLAGTGGNFCTGYDLKDFAAAGLDGDRLPPPVQETETNGPMGPTRMTLSKPSVAAISGYCVAGGLELALTCDLRVAEEGAILGVFCRRVGVPLIDGGTVRLPAIVGLGRAMDLILTGREVTAEEAFGMGLVNRVVPRGTARQAAIDLATSITAHPEQCMRTDRASALHAQFQAASFTQALAYEFEHGMKVIASESLPGARQFAARSSSSSNSGE